MMGTKLSLLHGRLKTIRRQRRRARLTVGWAGLVTAAGWILFGVFLADFYFRMERPERAVLMLIAAAGLVWAYRRWMAPWLGKSETELDMALLVERQQHIDSDVVASLEFEWPDAPRWGSVQLEQAVIEQTAQTLPNLPVKADIPAREIRRRLAALAATALLLGGLALAFPEYRRAFFNRLALGALHYPTRTTIETLWINDNQVSLSRPDQEVPSPYGRAVKFRVAGKGSLPETGSVEMTGEKGMKAEVPLTPVDEPSNEDCCEYAGELPRLVDSARCTFLLGDAWSEPIRLRLVPPPVVRLRTEVQPPEYTGAAPEVFDDVRQVSVIEGSRVVVRIVSDKELKEAALSIDNKPYAMVREANRPADSTGDAWSLPAEGSPLTAITEPVRYTVQVTDVDGLQIERPIEGVVRIKADRPPQIAASTLTQYVLPSARPSVLYTATDDYGVAKVKIRAEVVHADGKEEEKPEIVIYEFAKGKPPEKSVQNKYRIPLAPLGVVKGDTVKLTLSAEDYRGAKEEGRSTLSEPLIFQVTDERGIYAALSEQDRESLDRITNMIDNQTDVGEAK
ncbi:MAG: DUF4175 family protein [Thermoguttaceae bacterium]